jgi:hypothetical protein
VVYQLKTKLGFLSLQHLQLYSTLVDIASGIFGGKKAKPVNVSDMTPENAVAHINDFFKKAGGG